MGQVNVYFLDKLSESAYIRGRMHTFALKSPNSSAQIHLRLDLEGTE